MRHSPPRLVFVYGTLRRGEERDINLLAPAPTALGAASVAGRLYDLGSYPGLRLGGPGWVEGEVYAVSPELERRLDEIEAVWPAPSGEYLKREVWVSLKVSDGASSVNGSASQNDPDVAGAPPLLCLLYEASPDAVHGCFEIAGGNWVAYRRNQLQGPSA
ncbi:MAG: gamma-glutamylcyclotransferase [Polaromonas sp.]|nr:gamma-glutamylcyclotransferase [Polaromonas sp.]